ncbi:MAG: DUF2764 family protein [Bacteroidales bacterium]|nr:DUF2764 family protein [Bacteroidales bacterium]
MFDAYGEVEKALEESNLTERELKIDQIKWNWLENNTFFHYFSMERVFAFTVQLSILSRWATLEETKGAEIFKETLRSLEKSYVLPEEFTV